MTPQMNFHRYKLLGVVLQMLSETLVVDYIKRNLGAPVMQLEITDEEIINYVKNYTIPLFSSYKPYEAYLTIDLSRNPEYRINDNTIRIPLPDDRKLISITKVLPTLGDYFISGFPYNPMPSWRSLGDYLLNMTKSLATYKMTSFSFTWKFIRPDKLIILPKMATQKSFFTIFATFTHTWDTIPTDWERHFLDLALADIYDYIASLRVKYQNYTTPYGDINLNWDYFNNKASELRSRVIQDLQQTKPVIYGFVR